jgi:uncharacterized membrane protein YfcA
MDPTIVIAAVAFLASFTQSLTGFGSALVAMALLPEWIGLRSAAPLVALLAGTIELVLLARHRQSIRLRSIWRLALAAILGTPIGLVALRATPERLALVVLGAVISGYSLYALIAPRLPRLSHPAWAYPFGFLAGALGGAYNTSGPPAILYADLAGWPPSEFRANLQGLFLVGDAAVILGHAVSGNLTTFVFRSYGLTLVALALGIWIGGAFAARLNPAAFRKVAQAVLCVVGLGLIFG